MEELIASFDGDQKVKNARRAMLAADRVEILSYAAIEPVSKFTLCVD